MKKYKYSVNIEIHRIVQVEIETEKNITVGEVYELAREKARKNYGDGDRFDVIEISLNSIEHD